MAAKTNIISRFGLVLITFCAVMLNSLVAVAESTRPNIVLIVADDVALMDFSAYGGEARTPHIDSLAEQGALFTNHHTTPMCAPSRAMLLTGMDNHLTGLACIPEVLPPEHRGKRGYSMHLEPGVLTIADRLRPLGYRTLMTGKWHLGHGPGQLPDSHGFDRSFVLDASGADNWEQRPYLPYYKTAPWFEDGKPAALPNDFYSSKFLVDKMIDYIDAGPAGVKPFFAYVAFQAVHMPVQAPREFTDNYRGVYDNGWQELRRIRWEKAQSRGLVPVGSPLADMHPALPKWDHLSHEAQRLYSRRMEVYAGMLEAMDHHIGRLIAHLKAKGVYDNTLFIVTSDNGPEAASPVDFGLFKLWLWMVGYDSDNLETMGEKGNFGLIGPAWAGAAASPSDLFKFYSGEGGLRVPLVITGPGIAPAKNHSAFCIAADIVPTILELLGGSADDAITGRSMLAVLKGTAERVYPADQAVGIETSGNAALFRGDFKLVRNLPPYGDKQWKLYNLAADPGETRDLAGSQPALFDLMRGEYARYADAGGILEMPEGYEAVKQAKFNSLPVIAENYWWVLLIGLTGLLLFLFLIRRMFGFLRSHWTSPS